ncbi:MAG: hypothetical protein DSM106950_19105 [Stigonema ocellatum SAG 48.90 = DSM 106950]|nr:hypothetical protein [Stigonema ocellatum SAG 48.90 = DSM 106950]
MKFSNLFKAFGLITVLAISSSTMWLFSQNKSFAAPLGCTIVSSDGNLHSGQKLSKGQCVPSTNYFDGDSNYYYLNMQGDGNLVLIKSNGTPIWAPGTNPNGSYAIMQGDGNLVVYNSNNSPLWASNTVGNSGAQLTVQNDGNAVIYLPVWATNTQGK